MLSAMEKGRDLMTVILYSALVKCKRDGPRRSDDSHAPFSVWNYHNKELFCQSLLKDGLADGAR